MGVIRPVGAGDRSAVLAVVDASGLFGAGESAQVAATLDAYLGGGTGERWVVADDGAGVAYYAPERMTDGTWNLLLLATHPERRGRGVGTALVRHVEEELRRDGVRVLLIETSGTAEFAPQCAFYEGLGYVREARIRDFYTAGDDKIVYGKHLDLRIGGEDDLPALLDLADAFYREHGFTTSRADLAANLRTLIASPAAHVVIVDGTAFAITTTSFGLESGLIAELEDLYVRPAQRGAGWGKRLIDDATSWAATRGAAYLEVVTAQRELSAYYARHGFVDEGRQLFVRPLR